MGDLAVRYSDACTRAGIAALLGAVLSFSFADRLGQIAPLNAFGNYVLGRELLDVSLEEITSSRFWEPLTKALADDPSKGVVTLDHLSSLECVDSSAHGLSVRKRATSEPVTGPNEASTSVVGSRAGETKQSTTQAGTQAQTKSPGLVPSAPQLDVSTIESCPGVDELLLAVKRLWDTPLLDLARTSSNEASVEIYRWELNTHRLGRFVSFTDKGFTSGGMEMSELEQLNKLPRTSVADFSAMIRDRMAVKEPYSSDTQSVLFASLLVEFAVLTVLAYFYLNFTAMRGAGLLTAPGTVFLTMWSNIIGRVFYVIVLLLPAISAIWLSLRMNSVSGVLAKVLAVTSTYLTVLIMAKSAQVAGLHVGK